MALPNFRRKQEDPAENYLHQLENMLDQQQSILLPRNQPRPSDRQGASSPAPPQQPEPEQQPEPTPTVENPQESADAPETTPYYVFNQSDGERADQPPTPAGDSAAEQAPPAAPSPAADPSEPADETADLTSGFTEGALLLWDGPTLGVFKHHVPSKGYDLVYVLTASGKMDPQGLALHAYGAKQIGMLPDEILAEFEKKAAWKRDAVVFHLFDYSNSDSIPRIIPEKHRAPKPTPTPRPAPDRPAPPSASPAPAAKPPDPSKSVIDTLQRGSRISLRIGEQEWKAIYWGRDLQGTVVAHNSTQDWRLMHLDLERFKDNLVVHGVLDDKEFLQLTRKIRHSASTTY